MSSNHLIQPEEDATNDSRSRGSHVGGASLQSVRDAVKILTLASESYRHGYPISEKFKQAAFRTTLELLQDEDPKVRAIGLNFFDKFDKSNAANVHMIAKVALALEMQKRNNAGPPAPPRLDSVSNFEPPPSVMNPRLIKSYYGLNEQISQEQHSDEGRIPKRPKKPEPELKGNDIDHFESDDPEIEEAKETPPPAEGIDGFD